MIHLSSGVVNLAEALPARGNGIVLMVVGIIIQGALQCGWLAVVSSRGLLMVPQMTSAITLLRIRFTFETCMPQCCIFWESIINGSRIAFRDWTFD